MRLLPVALCLATWIASVAAQPQPAPQPAPQARPTFEVASIKRNVSGDQNSSITQQPGGRIVVIDKNAEHWGRLKTPAWEKWFERRQLENLLRRHCQDVSSDFISYWEDVPPDGLFIAWKAVR